MSVRRGPPSSDEVLLAFKRHASDVEIRLSTWPDGRASVTVAFRGLRSAAPRWRFTSLHGPEVRRVAEALIEAANREGWP